MTARQCHRDGCASGARWEAHLHLDCEGPGYKRRLSMRSTIECCDAHQAEARDYLLSPANRESITTRLSDEGFPEPNFLTARVEFKPAPESREPITVIVPCDREGCANPAKWRVVQAIPEIGRKEARYRAMTNLCVCEKHRKNTKPADLLDKASRDATYAVCQKHGVWLPDLDHMTLEFEPLAHRPKELVT